MKLHVPVHLVEEIRNNRCVAFLGAGFTGAAHFPTWTTLIQAIADSAKKSDRIPQDQYDFLCSLIKKGTGPELDQAMQMLTDALGSDVVADHLRTLFSPSDPLPEEMTRRLDLIKSIPFRAILTTNFDQLLPGPVSTDLERRPFEEILRSSHSPSVTHYPSPVYDIPVIQLHGRVDVPSSVVCTREAYRKLLNLTPGYATFLRSLMSTYTVLYIGFSFSDQYLNQLRSEVMAMMRPTPRAGEPFSYAIVMDKEKEQAAFYLRHENTLFLNWNTRDNTDFSGVERYLWVIRNRCSDYIQLGALLHGRRILCHDPHYETDYGIGNLVEFMYHSVWLYEREDDDEVWQQPSDELKVKAREKMFRECKMLLDIYKSPTKSVRGRSRSSDADKDPQAQAKEVEQASAHGSDASEPGHSHQQPAENGHNRAVSFASDTQEGTVSQNKDQFDPSSANAVARGTETAASKQPSPSPSPSPTPSPASSAASDSPPIRGSSTASPSPSPSDVVSTVMKKETHPDAKYMQKRKVSSADLNPGAVPLSHDHQVKDIEYRCAAESFVVHRALSIESFTKALENCAPEEAYDVAICNYGFRQGQKPFVADLMAAMHAVNPDKRAPVIVLSNNIDPDLRKREVLRYGAVGYAYSEAGLFEALYSIFREPK
jgi:hypothetical protein